MRFGSMALALVAACAVPQARGAFRISATHYESMTGVKVGSGADAMTCSRDTITGSHILRWYCQYEANGPQYQLQAPIRLDLRVR
ncbi:MAG: hypothetical protein E6J84_13660 [Deltaproteobacteria bacterium]|nr:MAG: hypothetical protein E6J84_13660 [Deltaproteobacteria bacterium]